MSRRTDIMPNEQLVIKRQLKRFRIHHKGRRDPKSHVRSDIEERSGTVGNDTELAGGAYRRAGCKYSNMPQNTRVTVGLANHSFTVRNTITEDTLTNTFASGDEMTGDAPIARTGWALCRRVILDSVAHSWVPARTPTVRLCLYGGRPWVALISSFTRNTETTRPRLQRHALVTNMVAEPVC